MARAPYDSDEGRAYAAAITALMTGRLPQVGGDRRAGPVRRLPAERRRDDRRDVNAPRGGRQHRELDVVPRTCSARPQGLGRGLNLGEVHGYNAQATVLAPPGRSASLMDCDTTGVEPDFSLVKSKKLVGSGEITIPNKTVPMALEARLRAARGSRRSSRSWTSATPSSGAEREGETLPGLRLRDRRPRDPLHRPREDDAPSSRSSRARRSACPRRPRWTRSPALLDVEARRQGDRDLPRQLQGRSHLSGQKEGGAQLEAVRRCR